eukprot:482564-Rhodomonas_salina.2
MTPRAFDGAILTAANLPQCWTLHSECGRLLEEDVLPLATREFGAQLPIVVGSESVQQTVHCWIFVVQSTETKEERRIRRAADSRRSISSSVGIRASFT